MNCATVYWRITFMHLEKTIIERWKLDLDYCLPGLLDAIQKHHPLHLCANIYLPNPLALIYLKMQSYFHAPDRRKKDFADLIELILRLSAKSEILCELKNILNSFSDHSVRRVLLQMCKAIEYDHTGPWDLDDVREQIKERHLFDVFTADEIRQHFEFFRIKVLE